MTTRYEPNHQGEFLQSEGNGYISREEVTLAITTVDLAPGTVLGVNASGNYAPYDNAATDGTQTAKAILYRGVKASTTTQPGLVIARLAEVKEALLVGYDAAAGAELASAFIFAR